MAPPLDGISVGRAKASIHRLLHISSKILNVVFDFCINVVFNRVTEQRTTNPTHTTLEEEMSADHKPFDEWTDDEQNALMDQWIREAVANPVCVVMPAETHQEGYYHRNPN